MKKRIHYHDTDAGGVVYYGNYLKYMEEARSEYLEDRGMSVSDLQKKGYVFVVRKCTIDYRRPARYGDTISCDAVPIKITPTQIIFNQKVYLQKTGEVLVNAQVGVACITLKDFRPAQIPADLRMELAVKGT